MASGLAALAGILSGFGQVPKSLQQMDENERAQQRLAQQQQQFQSSLGMQQQQLDAQERARQETQAHNAALLAETKRHREFQEGKETRDRARLPGLAEAVRSSATTPGQLEAPLGMGEDQEAAAFLPRTQTQTDPGMLALAQLIPMMAPERAEAAATKALEPRVVGDKQRLWMPGRGFLDPTPPGQQAPRTFQPPEGYIPEYSVKDDGSTTTTYKARVDLSQRVADILKANSVNPLTATPEQIQRARQQAHQEELNLAAARNELPKAPPAEQKRLLADMRTFINALDEAARVYDPKFVGPIEGRMGALRQLTGIGADPREVDFRTLLSSFRNQLLYLRSGAAVTPQEYERILNELPVENDPDTVFPVKLQRARALLLTALRNREAEFGRGGGAPAPAPSPAPAAQPRATHRFNPATGRLEPIQ